MAGNEGGPGIPGRVAENDEDTGWSWFEQQANEVAERREREDGLTTEDIQRHYAKVFATKSGQIVFRDLMRFRQGASFDPSLGFYNGAAYGYYREGVRQMPEYVEQMTERGNGG